jgi:hypothetical protein
LSKSFITKINEKRVKEREEKKPGELTEDNGKLKQYFNLSTKGR